MLDFTGSDVTRNFQRIFSVSEAPVPAIYKRISALVAFGFKLNNNVDVSKNDRSFTHMTLLLLLLLLLLLIFLSFLSFT